LPAARNLRRKEVNPMDKPRKEEGEKRQPYSRPAMVEYGQVLALTQGDH
jgi:hypothetical protein